MAYTLPRFVTPFDYWESPKTPALPKDGVLLGQLYVHSRRDMNRPGLTADPSTPLICIRYNLAFPPLIQYHALPVFSFLMCLDPNNAQRYYQVRYWEWTHQGFPNVYVTAFVLQCSITGVSPDPLR